MKEIVLLSTADWSHPFWTNKQHTARTLAKLGYRVLYIDSLGSRKLRLAQGRDLKRVWARLKGLFSRPKEVESNIYVWTPCLLPPRDTRFRQVLNWMMFNLFLKFWMHSLGFSHRAWLWTYSPLTLLYLSKKSFAKLIYHCVDNIAEQPDAFVKLIQREERRLFEQADQVFVTSRELENLARKVTSKVAYYPNVVDFEHFNQALSNDELPQDVRFIPKPIAMFIGAISAYKMNLALMLDVAKELTDVSFVFIGAVGEGDPGTQVEALKVLPNVHLLGPKSYQSLPDYLRAASVCLIPANINEYTKSMFPMKFFEYLAAGKPVVATDIPAIKEFAEHYYEAATAADFAMQIQNALREHRQDRVTDGLSLASQHTYLTRTEKMLACLNV